MRNRLLKLFFVLAALLIFGGRASTQNPICSQLSFSVANGMTATCTASAAISAGQILTVTSTGVQPIATSATSGAFAIALQNAISGGTLLVMTDGQGQVSTDNSCTVGYYIIPSTTTAGSGHCTNSPGSTQWAATAIQASSAAGSVYASISPLSTGEAGTGGGSSAWSAITAGSNTNILSMGSGGALTPTSIGVGVVEANAIYAATVSTLPSASTSNGQAYVVTDIATFGSCATGSGTYLGLCRSNGTSWVWVGESVGVAQAAPPTATIYFSPLCPVGSTASPCIYTPANTQILSKGVCSTSSTTLTCPSGTFTAADVGKYIWGGNNYDPFRDPTTDLNMTAAHFTIATYVSSSQVTLSGTPTNPLATGAGSYIIWGNPDDTGAAALDAALQLVSFCPKVEMAAAGYMFTTPHFYAQPAACNSGAGLTPGNTSLGNFSYYYGFELTGRGVGTTTWFLPPDFPETGSCAQSLPGTAADLCFAVPLEAKFDNFSIASGSELTGIPSGKALIGLSVGQIDYFTATNIGGNANQTYCIEVNFWAQLRQINISNCGYSGIHITGTATAMAAQFQNIRVENNRQYNYILDSGGSFGCTFCSAYGSQTAGTGQIAVLNNGGRMDWFNGQIIPGGGTAQTSPIMFESAGAGAILHLTNATVGSTGTTTGIIDINCITAACTNYLLGDTLIVKNAAGSYGIQDGSASSITYDMGGNNLSNRFNITGNVINEANSANVVMNSASANTISANWGTGNSSGTYTGGDFPTQFTITNGSGATGAAPTIAYVFPNPLPKAPFSCTATQTGGTNATGTFTTSALSATGVTFTYSLTPTASDTEIIQVLCVTP